MYSKPLSCRHWLPFSLLLFLLLPSHGDALKPRALSVTPDASVEATVLLPKSWHKTLSLAEGQKVEVTAGIPKPSTLPPHARFHLAAARSGWNPLVSTGTRKPTNSG
jgi:hypothetical protein